MKHLAKPFICVLLVIAMVLCFSACGKDTSGLGTLDIGDSSGDGSLAPLGGGDTKDSEPAPEPEPSSDTEPTPEPSSEPSSEPDGNPGDGNEFVVTEYSCDYFDCYIPQGWNVAYNVIDAGGGIMRIYVFVQDPSDPNNIIFFVSATEPYFTSVSDKNALVSVLGSAYEWSPVLNELSAAGLLEQWASIYTLMDATGFSDGVKYFKNYSLVSVLESEIQPGSNEQETASQVLAEVSIPNASQTYGMLYANDFIRLQYPYGDASYYASYSNRGFVLSADRFEAEAEGMLYCTTSFDFTKFNNKYNSSTGFTDNDHRVSNQPVTLPDRKSFTGE